MAKKQFRLTDEERDRIMEASKPVPYLVVGGVVPMSPGERAMLVWREVASRVGCDVQSIGPASTGDDRDFMATPLA